MVMNILNWQIIEVQQAPAGQDFISYVRTERVQIPGGWLVRTFVLRRETTQPPGGVADIETNLSVGLTFVPDIHGIWN